MSGIYCPYCGAAAGVECKSSNGKHLVDGVHAERLKLEEWAAPLLAEIAALKSQRSKELVGPEQPIVTDWYAMTEATSPFLAADVVRVGENRHAFAIRDRFPVSPGHTLIIPKKVNWRFGFGYQTRDETNDCWRLVWEQEHILREMKHEGRFPDGFNIGINQGQAAGQTVAHAHIHIIPRYRGDVPNPRGGIRGVIPGKANY